MFRPLFPVVFFLGGCFSFGADFYVDSKIGNDVNLGTSARTAWKSLDKVNQAKLQPGDRILFRSDCVWTGVLKTKSGESDKPITYSSYNKGNKPSLRNSISLTRTTPWNKEGESVWSTPINLPAALVEMQTDLLKVQGRWETMQMADAKGRWENFNQDGFQGLHFHCEDPGTLFYYREIIFSPLRIEEGKEYVFHFKAKSTIPFEMGERSVRFLRTVPPHTVYCTPENVPGKIKTDWNDYYIVFKNEKEASDARITVNLGGMVPKGAVFSFLPIEMTENVEKEPIVSNLVMNHAKSGIRKTDLELLREQGDFLFDEKTSKIFLFSKKIPYLEYTQLEIVLRGEPIIALSKQKHVVLDGLDVRYSGGHGMQGGDVQDLIIRNCDISWVGGGSTNPNRKPSSRAGNGIEFYGNAENILIEGCRIGNVFGTGIASVGQERHKRTHLTFTGNTIWNCDISIGFYPESKLEAVAVTDNLCFGAGKGWGVQQEYARGIHLQLTKMSENSKAIEIKDNRFSTSQGPLIQFGCKTGSPAVRKVESDKNMLWQPDGTALISFENESFKADRFAEYRKATGLDANSKVAEPEFAIPKF